MLIDEMLVPLIIVFAQTWVPGNQYRYRVSHYFRHGGVYWGYEDE